MKRYRLPLFIALLFALWLFFGRDLISRVLNPHETTVIEGLPDGLRGRLIYTQGRDGVWQVDLATGERSVWWALPGVGYVGGIAVSPDKQSFVVAYEPQMPDDSPISSTDLYLLTNAPDIAATPLLERETLTEVYDHPFWSTDGAWIYFGHYKLQLSETGAVEGNRQTVERLRVDTPDAEPEVLVEGAVEMWVNADLSQAVYVYFDPETFVYSLRLSDADGNNPREVLPANLFLGLSSPRISPDGRYVYFSASGQPMNATTSDLGVVQAHGAPWDLWRLDIESGDYTRMTNLGIDGPELAWSPDGTHLAIVALEGVYVFDLAADDVYLVADSTAEGEIVWLSD